SHREILASATTLPVPGVVALLPPQPLHGRLSALLQGHGAGPGAHRPFPGATQAAVGRPGPPAGRDAAGRAVLGAARERGSLRARARRQLRGPARAGAGRGAAGAVVRRTPRAT